MKKKDPKRKLTMDIKIIEQTEMKKTHGELKEKGFTYVG